MEVTIKHDAKCKHCKHFEKGWYIKEDGTQSKKKLYISVIMKNLTDTIRG